MQVVLARWGSSLGLRIPKEIATRRRLREGEQFEVETDGDPIVIAPRPSGYRLTDLLQGTTPEAMREAFNWGPDKGRERPK